MNYQERQDLWVKENNVKPEDTVKVLFKVPSNTLGWNAFWVEHMDTAVGCECTVEAYPGGWGDSGIMLNMPGVRANFPYFCLEKVEKPKKRVKALQKVEALEKRFTTENEKLKRIIARLQSNINHDARVREKADAKLSGQIDGVTRHMDAELANEEQSRKEIHERIDAEISRVRRAVDTVTHIQGGHHERIERLEQKGVTDGR